MNPKKEIIEEVWNTVPPVGETSIRFVRDMQTITLSQEEAEALYELLGKTLKK